MENELMNEEFLMVNGYIQLFLEGKVYDDKKFWYVDLTYNVNIDGSDLQIICNISELYNCEINRENKTLEYTKQFPIISDDLFYWNNIEKQIDAKIDINQWDFGISNKLYFLMVKKIKEYYKEEEKIDEKNIQFDSSYEIYFDD